MALKPPGSVAVTVTPAVPAATEIRITSVPETTARTTPEPLEVA